MLWDLLHGKRLSVFSWLAFKTHDYSCGLYLAVEALVQVRLADARGAASSTGNADSDSAVDAEPHFSFIHRRLSNRNSTVLWRDLLDDKTNAGHQEPFKFTGFIARVIMSNRTSWWFIGIQHELFLCSKTKAIERHNESLWVIVKYRHESSSAVVL